VYLADEMLERGVLRQGDILANVQILGAIALKSVRLISSPASGNKATAWQVDAPPQYGYAMVLSHSCEIAPENKVKVTSVILAPLRDLNKATDPARRYELIASNLIDRENPQASYLKYFYVEPSAAIPFSDGAVVDFSKCFSVRNKSYGELAERKVLQLQPDVISSMALKLALYFHRRQAA
jgi:hypothetical protein